MNEAEALAWVRRLHALVDDLVAPLQVQAPACRRGCAGCCQDGVTVFEIEAARLLADAPELFHGDPASTGCALLGPGGECRAYAARPYVCRTQGLPLRWAEGGVEHRDRCPLNDAAGELLALPPEACWTIGPVEARLRAVQVAVDGGAARRVALRALFDPR